MAATPFDLSGRGVVVTGGIAVYLASDASAHTTGEKFVIDGGCTKF